MFLGQPEVREGSICQNDAAKGEGFVSVANLSHALEAHDPPWDPWHLWDNWVEKTPLSAGNFGELLPVQEDGAVPAAIIHLFAASR